MRTSDIARPRVFQIGFNRCGTRSISHLFEAAGHAVVHWDIPSDGRDSAAPIEDRTLVASVMDDNRRRGRPLLDGIDRYDLYADMEMMTGNQNIEAFRWFREIDTQYPGSRFILNLRDREHWIRSRLRHSRGTYAERWREYLGSSTTEELVLRWRADWDDHLSDVRAYFSGRPADLVEFDIECGSAEVLVSFFTSWNLNADEWTVRGGARRSTLLRRLLRPLAR